MPDDIGPAPQQLPENPTTAAELLQFFPLPYDYAKQWACVFSAELAGRLEAVQNENPKQFRVSPIALTDGSYMIRGAIMSECGIVGYYAENFQQLDIDRFGEISIIPWADAVALLPVSDPEEV